MFLVRGGGLGHTLRYSGPYLPLLRSDWVVFREPYVVGTRVAGPQLQVRQVFTSVYLPNPGGFISSRSAPEGMSFKAV